MDAVLGHEQKFEDLCEALRSKIKSFKRSNPNLSGLQIAKIFGMASSTLNRIENRSIRTPSIDQVVKVLRGVGAHDELIGFMDEHYPAISDTFRNHISLSKTQLLDIESVKVILEQGYFRIFLLAVCGNGVEESYIKESFGSLGISRAQTLISKNIIVLEDGIFRLSKTCNLALDEFSSKEFFVRLVNDQYKPINENGKSTGFISTSTCSVKDESTILAVKTILKEARDKVRALVDDPNNKGDVKYFFGICSDTII